MNFSTLAQLWSSVRCDGRPFNINMEHWAWYEAAFVTICVPKVSAASQDHTTFYEKTQLDKQGRCLFLSAALLLTLMYSVFPSYRQRQGSQVLPTGPVRKADVLVTDVYDLTRVKKLNNHFKVFMFVEIMSSHYASNSGQGERVDDYPGYDVNDDTDQSEL